VLPMEPSDQLRAIDAQLARLKSVHDGHADAVPERFVESERGVDGEEEGKGGVRFESEEEARARAAAARSAALGASVAGETVSTQVIFSHFDRRNGLLLSLFVLPIV
jgi:hypothetical protein